jgi:Nuclear pore assembly and biogenesis
MAKDNTDVVLDYLKSNLYTLANTSYEIGTTFAQDYVVPGLRSLFSTHPDIASLLLLLLILYTSLMILNTATRWMYSFVMTVIRMIFLAALVLGAVWIIKIGQGEDASASVASSVDWAKAKGREYILNIAGGFINRR